MSNAPDPAEVERHRPQPNGHTVAALAERLAENSRRDESGCVVWTRPLHKGYGQISVAGRRMWAHRAAYELKHGPIPSSMVLDHLCRNTACINPDHLEAVTQRENVLRGSSKVADLAARTHCPRGHAFAETAVRNGNGRGRKCRECERERDRQRTPRNRTAGAR